MAPGDIVQIFIVIILLLLSAFFSSAETALTTVNRVRMRTLADDGNKKAQRVLDITDNKAKMLSAILIGNNVVNLSASSLFYACDQSFRFTVDCVVNRCTHILNTYLW